MHPKEMELVIGKNPTYENYSIINKLSEIISKNTYLKIWMWREYF